MCSVRLNEGRDVYNDFYGVILGRVENSTGRRPSRRFTSVAAHRIFTPSLLYRLVDFLSFSPALSPSPSLSLSVHKDSAHVIHSSISVPSQG